MKRIVLLCAVSALLTLSCVPTYAWGSRYDLQRKAWTTQQAQDMRALEAQAAKAFQSKHYDASKHKLIYSPFSPAGDRQMG